MSKPKIYSLYSSVNITGSAMEDLELDVDVTLPIFIQLNVKRESEKDWLETSRWVKFQVSKNSRLVCSFC